MLIASSAQGIRAQADKKANAPATTSGPADSLAEALSAACSQDQTAFATHLTTENAQAFRELPQSQRTAVMRRFVLLEDPGKPLLSTNSAGLPILQCDADGASSEMRFGVTEAGDNLSFIRVEVPQAAQPNGQTQSVRFGLVREAGEWKLLSVGLLLLDIPALEHEWEAADVEARETGAIASLRKIAEALKVYQRAFGRLPETLDQLGPAPDEGASPEKAGLLDAQLAMGESEGYGFRYNIVPVAGGEDESDRNKAAGFALAATPKEYGMDGRRSFYLDSAGKLRGGDKHTARRGDRRGPEHRRRNTALAMR